MGGWGGVWWCGVTVGDVLMEISLDQRLLGTWQYSLSMLRGGSDDGGSGKSEACKSMDAAELSPAQHSPQTIGLTSRLCLILQCNAR